MTAVNLDLMTFYEYQCVSFSYLNYDVKQQAFVKSKTNIKNSQNVFEFSSLRSWSMSARPLTSPYRRFINIIMTKARWSMKKLAENSSNSAFVRSAVAKRIKSEFLIIIFVQIEYFDGESIVQVYHILQWQWKKRLRQHVLRYSIKLWPEPHKYFFRSIHAIFSHHFY